MTDFARLATMSASITVPLVFPAHKLLTNLSAVARPAFAY